MSSNALHIAIIGLCLCFIGGPHLLLGNSISQNNDHSDRALQFGHASESIESRLVDHLDKQTEVMSSVGVLPEVDSHHLDIQKAQSSADERNLIRCRLVSRQGYIGLINRFRKWYKRVGSDTPDVLGFLKLEYSRADNELAQEMCQQNPDLKENSLNNMDFVFEVLKRLIDRLETLELESGEADEQDDKDDLFFDALDTDPDEEDNRLVAKAMSRIKNTLGNVATKAIKQEGIVMADMAMLHFVSIGLKSFVFPWTIETALELLVGNGDIPFVTKYLRSLSFRTLQTIFNLHPFDYLSCKLKERAKKE